MQASIPSEGNVRFGSKADICGAKQHVRSTPNSDRKSRLPQKVMSALPPIADMCTAPVHVRFGPKADIGNYSIASSARASSVGGTVRLSALAVFRLITSSNFVARSTGKSAGLVPFKILSTNVAARRNMSEKFTP